MAGSWLHLGMEGTHLTTSSLIGATIALRGKSLLLRGITKPSIITTTTLNLERISMIRGRIR